MATKTRQAMREAYIEQAMAEALRFRQVEVGKTFANSQPLAENEKVWLTDIGRRAGEKFDRENPKGRIE